MHCSRPPTRRCYQQGSLRFYLCAVLQHSTMQCAQGIRRCLFFHYVLHLRQLGRLAAKELRCQPQREVVHWSSRRQGCCAVRHSILPRAHRSKQVDPILPKEVPQDVWWCHAVGSYLQREEHLLRYKLLDQHEGHSSEQVPSKDLPGSYDDCRHEHRVLPQTDRYQP